MVALAMTARPTGAARPFIIRTTGKAQSSHGRCWSVQAGSYGKGGKEYGARRDKPLLAG